MATWNGSVRRERLARTISRLFSSTVFLARAQAYQKSGGDSTMNYYLNQKKTLEVNPRHPLIKDLLRRIEDSKDDQTAVVRFPRSQSVAMLDTSGTF